MKRTKSREQGEKEEEKMNMHWYQTLINAVNTSQADQYNSGRKTPQNQTKCHQPRTKKKPKTSSTAAVVVWATKEIDMKKKKKRKRRAESRKFEPTQPGRMGINTNGPPMGFMNPPIIGLPTTDGTAAAEAAAIFDGLTAADELAAMFIGEANCG